MRHVTIDASVVIARLLGEPRPAWVDGLIADAVAGRTGLIAPSLMWLEVGNRLARSPQMTDERALEGMLRVDALPIEVIEVDRPQRLRALQLARQYDLTIYDAVYLAVADAARAPLVTLDRELEQAAQEMGLGRDGESSRASEVALTYGGAPVDLGSITAIGAALAEMRAGSSWLADDERVPASASEGASAARQP